MASLIKTVLDEGWSYSLVDAHGTDTTGVTEGEWTAVKHFPTTVHVELLREGKIPDPFIGLNEWDVQWVGEADWSFKTRFSVDEKQLAAPNADLIFDGLDTFATVLLNGTKILESDNQFVAHRVSVASLLRANDNDLVIDFASAFRKGREIEAQHEKLHLWNGDSSRLHVRKAQYNYGWDWGPVLMTAGPWKPISLETYVSRIAEIDIRTNIDEGFQAKLDVDFSVVGPGRPLTAKVKVLQPNGLEAIDAPDVKVKDGSSTSQFTLEKDRYELWYPVGYGQQPLYTLEIVISDEQGNVLDVKRQKFGFRNVKVVQDELVDQPGRTFLFEVNGTRVFCGGSNWIPADSFLTTMTRERYRSWLQLLVDGNQNMIRVWGGGIYEADDFYELCDELGILVWQDFMFGCGQYPAYDSLLRSIEIEAEQNVKRLRHHPSVVIFAGNNEDYQVAESFKLDLDYSDEHSDFRNTTFPARHIYERLLPSVVEKYSNIFYHRSSPYSGFGKPTTDRTYGDLHQWNVWHGSQEPWHKWDILSGRFVSEFGMQGYPDIRTVDYWLGGNKAERFPQSRTMNNHNKADGFERRLELYLMENFKHAFDIESYVYYTQIMQAETLASAYRLWRRDWKGKGREYTAGALVWQINDCWPVTSWAIVDYFLRPKPAYFSIKRELRPYTVGMARKDVATHPDALSAARVSIESRLEIWGTNSTLAEKKVTLDVASFDLHSAWTDRWTQDVVLAPNAATELWAGTVPGQPTRTKLSDAPRTIVVSARLLDEAGAVLARYTNWPEPFKFIHYPAVQDLGLEVSVGADGESVQLSTQRPIKGIVLDVEGEEVQWGDQAIDLVPGDPQVISAVGLKGRTVKARFLGDGTA
ncbi:glycoside hydrolase family 2 protein [Phanerochaete carnosa HHB-10118-sp]|uniref:Beta-mannosidase B n=1 Tax=Phanerochaete carnosa (strain HHB-10118-sp) TaxID=650164 RepID=K5W7D6_PHACS|nr:glycoside hydrolase family 2 protein [Phanerochaete carnosa HHB-10118-sp]EKM59838.1 glycoside hydrolase family 2 protein [Phanerochaete carnosa HHB-10118-sp]